MDMLRALVAPNMDIRKKVLDIALDLIDQRNIDEARSLVLQCCPAGMWCHSRDVACTEASQYTVGSPRDSQPAWVVYGCDASPLEQASFLDPPLASHASQLRQNDVLFSPKQHEDGAQVLHCWPLEPSMLLDQAVCKADSPARD